MIPSMIKTSKVNGRMHDDAEVTKWISSGSVLIVG